MTFKRIYITFVALFIVYAAFHAGRYYERPHQPYIIAYDTVDDAALRRCRQSIDCMDILAWDDLCLREEDTQ